MAKQFLAIFILFLSFFCSCGKNNLNERNIGIALNLNDPEYIVLKTDGASLQIPELGRRGLYIMRTDPYSFVIYDLFNPNFTSAGLQCILKLVAQINILTDPCNNIQYDVLTGGVISVPDGIFITPKPLIQYNYTFATNNGEEILYIL